MILEVDKIIRSLADIRKALFSLSGKTTTAAQAEVIQEISEQADETEHTARNLEFELTGRGECSETT